MDLRQLGYLALLAEELSFTRAAERAHVAQPALSRQIRKLEDELGTPLVDRTSRRVRMTQAGGELAERARRILQDVDEARAALASREVLAHGRLTIGVTHSPGPVDVAALLREYHTRYPGIELVVREELSSTIAERLRADEIDLGLITALPAHQRQGLALMSVANEPLVLVVAPDHPIARRRQVGLRAVAAEPFVLYATGATVRTTVMSHAEEQGLALRVAFESNDPARIRAIAANGLAIGVLPRTDVERPGPEVAAVALRGEALSHEVFFAYRAERRLSAAAQGFRKLVAAGVVS